MKLKLGALILLLIWGLLLYGCEANQEDPLYLSLDIQSHRNQEWIMSVMISEDVSEFRPADVHNILSNQKLNYLGEQVAPDHLINSLRNGVIDALIPLYCMNYAFTNECSLLIKKCKWSQELSIADDKEGWLMNQLYNVKKDKIVMQITKLVSLDGFWTNTVDVYENADGKLIYRVWSQLRIYINGIDDKQFDFFDSYPYFVKGDNDLICYVYCSLDDDNITVYPVAIHTIIPYLGYEEKFTANGKESSYDSQNNGA